MLITSGERYTVYARQLLSMLSAQAEEILAVVNIVRHRLYFFVGKLKGQEAHLF